MLKIKKIENTDKYEIYQEIDSLDLDYNPIKTLAKLGEYTIEQLIQEKNNYYQMINNVDELMKSIMEL